jgi:hypothetical protein
MSCDQRTANNRRAGAVTRARVLPHAEPSDPRKIFEQKKSMSGKRNWEKIESEQAEKEKRQSEKRARTIAELFRAIEQLESSKKQPGEGILADARELAAQWKVKKRPLFEGLLKNNRLALLVALVVALRSSHQCLENIRRYLPNELENLISASEHREFRAFVSALSGTLPEPPPKRKYERKRRRWQRSFFNSIEYQFGGGLETEWKKANALIPPRLQILSVIEARLSG